MINEQPSKLRLLSIKAGYNKVYITTSVEYDADLLGIALWVKPQGSSTLTLHKADALDTEVVISGLLPNSTYEVFGAFYDSLVDDQLLNARANIEVSDTESFTTKSGPSILNIASESPDVDIGVTLPIVNFTMDGISDTVVIEYLKQGTSTWQVMYSGAMSSRISIPAPGIGKYSFRCKGIVYDAGGLISEVSAYNTYGTQVDLGFNLTNPEAPSTLSYKVAKTQDTFERYDVKLSWAWSKGTKAGLKGFIVSYVSEAQFNTSGFTNALTMSIGNTTSAIISNFPYNVPMKVKVTAVSYSPTSNTADSNVLSLTITSSTSLDNSFTKETNVTMSYNGIFGYRMDNTVRVPTFSMDAATGNLGIGTPSITSGLHPIQLNGTDGTLTVDGGIITKKINAADFVLTNFSGTDNPALYTEGKLWNDSKAGIWMGYDNVDGKYKFDLGNSSQSIKWDGTNLTITGNVTIGTTLGNIDLENVVGKRTVWIYKEDTTRPLSPTGTSYPPLNWSVTPIAVSNPYNVLWACSGKLNEITGQLDTGEVWSTPVQFTGGKGDTGSDGSDGISGNSSFKSIVFKRATTKPSTPTGASFANPVPSLWSDGVPVGDLTLWSSTRVFSDDGAFPQQTAWSVPVQLTDNSLQEIKYSTVATSPGDPTTNASNWYSTSNVASIWMAVRLKVNGVFQSWQISKIKGESGADGQDGSDGADGQDGANGYSGFKSIVFLRSTTQPPLPSGGSFASPVPSGWYDGVPAGSSILWSSTRIFTSNGAAPQTSLWTTPQQMTNTSTQEFKYSGVELSPGTPTTVASNWTTTSYESSIWMAMRQSLNGIYTEWQISKIKGESGADGQDGANGSNGQDGANGTNGTNGQDGAFKSTVFTRTNSTVTQPSGGSYSSPVPTTGGWYDNIPNGEAVLYASTRVFTPSGLSPQTPTWSIPVKMTDTSTQETKYSTIVNSPGNPSANAGNWSSTANSNSIWMAIRIKTNGVYGSWEISKIKGETGSNGIDGLRGAGMYVIATSTGAWSDSTANSACPSGAPVEDDVVTIFKSTNTAVAATKRFNGSAWVTPQLVIHGDMVATGTIAGDRITAFTEITAPTINGGTFQLIGPNIMLIQSATPFGPDSLVEWKGPKILNGTAPNFSLLRKSNAIMWSDSAGNTYFGGTLSAGILSTAVVNTQKSGYTVGSDIVAIGPFNSNGGAKSIVISYILDAEQDKTGSCPASLNNTYLSFGLYRKLGTGSWVKVGTSHTVTGFTNCRNESGRAVSTESNYLSLTIPDTTSSTSDFSYKLVCESYYRYHTDSNVINQSLSIRSTEA